MSRPTLALWILAVSLTASCSMGAATGARLPRIAERYVRLVLAMGNHDQDYVDAYYGPAEWRVEARAKPLPLSRIRHEADSLAAVASQAALALAKDDLYLRARYLADQLRALSARASMLEGAPMPFDKESEALYGSVAPLVADSVFERTVARIDSLLPGKGSLNARYDAFVKRFLVPRDRIEGVCAAAIEEARRRTKRHMALPDSEHFTVEYVTGKSWAAYNWYQGGYKSLIQVNLDSPFYISSATGIGCHEGYPGHHVLNVLHERDLVLGRGWVEYTIYPLYSPESFLAEGSADYGVDLTFPDSERHAFEKEVIFPLAGLDTTDADRFFELRRVERGLRYAGISAARRYLNGERDKNQTIAWLRTHALSTEQEARLAVAFYDQYRSYVINYAIGKDTVAELLERRASAGGPTAWTAFTDLLRHPSVVERPEITTAAK
jgi:hypothetical protein